MRTGHIFPRFRDTLLKFRLRLSSGLKQTGATYVAIHFVKLFEVQVRHGGLVFTYEYNKR